MKVLMINSVSGYGSTGSICVDLAEAIERSGGECYIAYGQGNSTYKKSYKIGSKIENHLHNIGSRLFGKQGYFSSDGTKKLVSFIKGYNPDVIHLHNLHGNYLNIKILFKYLNEDFNGKIVWTLHDCWSFTGKCAHYTEVKCYKWESHCYKCPQISQYPPSLILDQSSVMFDDKKQLFTSLKNLTLIPVSSWLSNEVRKSFFKDHDIHRIYNWINHKVFKISHQFSSIIDQFGLAEDKFTVLLVSAGWAKNDSKWIDANKLFNLFKQDPNVEFVLVGKLEKGLSIPHGVKYISYINNSEELAKVYSYANVYVHLSVEDTFGKVIAEALSCGTPAIVYDSTACVEIISESTGLAIEPRNVEDIARSITLLRYKEVVFKEDDCRNRVLSLFDIETNINETLNNYKN